MMENIRLTLDDGTGDSYDKVLAEAVNTREERLQ